MQRSTSSASGSNVERARAPVRGAAATLDAAATADVVDASVGDTPRAVIALARAISPSPAAVDAGTIERASATLSAAQIVEIAVWVSVCQLIRRLAVYCATA